jgi:Tol biopolymer transport system component
MNRTDWLTDDMIEAAFERRAGSASVGGLADAIASQTAATRQRSGWNVRLSGALPRSAGRPAWLAMAILVALLGLAIAWVLVGQRPQSPFRTGLLAYVRAGDIYIAHPDGSDAEVALHQDGVAFSTVAWSPDGSRLAVDGDSGTIVLDLSTGAPTFIGGGNPVWSPDGHELAVVDPSTQSSAAEGSRLRIEDVATGTTTAEYPFPAIGGSAWSPNGRWIAASGGTGARSNALVRIDVTTGQVDQLDGPSGMLDSEREVAWSPDSRHIAFIRWDVETAAGCRELCATDVIVADADGSHASRLNQVPAQADQPSWSPDGRWVAFRQANLPGSVDWPSIHFDDTWAGIAIAHPDGTAERALVAEGVQALAWGPNSDVVRFTHDEGRGLPATVWETSLAGVKRSLGVTLDSGSTPFERTGFGAAWQTVPGTAAEPTLPSIAPSAPAATPELVTPAPAEPADPGTQWPTLASDSMEGCQPVLVATSDGETTPIGAPCDQTRENAEAVWSPTGAVFATLVDGRLSILHHDGHVDAGVAGLSSLSSFSWSPKGNWLSVTGAKTFILQVNGSGLRELPGTPYWSPDERALAARRSEGTLFIGAGDGTGMKAVGSFPAYVTWSSDGSRFAFVRDGNVWTAAADGSDVRNVTAFPLGGASGAFWSPDDHWIAVVGTHGAWVLRPDGSDRRWLDLGVTTSFGNAAWSPGGRVLAVETSTDSALGQKPAIYLVNADGSPTVLIDAATTPIWSPDGRFLVVTHAQPNGSGFDTGDFELMNDDGSGRHQLPTKAGLNPPVWVTQE